MFEALVVTLREGIEAALVVGIILIYLRKTGREALSRPVYWGLAAGILGSLACAAIVAALGVQEEAYEGWLMIASAVLVTSMVIWMLRSSKRLKQQIEARVEAIASREAASGQDRGGSLAVASGLFGLTFVLVLREGVETVLFLAAVDLTTDALLAFFAGLVGIALAVLFGVSFVRGTARVDLPRFFKVTAVVLFVLSAQLLIGGLHEFGERGTIPIGAREMRLIGPIIKNDVLFLATLLALPLIVLLIPGRGAAGRAREAQGLEGPERRLARARRPQARAGGAGARRPSEATGAGGPQAGETLEADLRGRRDRRDRLSDRVVRLRAATEDDRPAADAPAGRRGPGAGREDRPAGRPPAPLRSDGGRRRGAVLREKIRLEARAVVRCLPGLRGVRIRRREGSSGVPGLRRRHQPGDARYGWRMQSDPVAAPGRRREPDHRGQ